MRIDPSHAYRISPPSDAATERTVAIRSSGNVDATSKDKSAIFTMESDLSCNTKKTPDEFRPAPGRMRVLVM